jgi:hypothetical protein
MKTFRSFTGSRLIEQRRRALAHHCRLAIETFHPRFRWIDGPFSILLTVNSGYE